MVLVVGVKTVLSAALLVGLMMGYSPPPSTTRRDFLSQGIVGMITLPGILGARSSCPVGDGPNSSIETQIVVTSKAGEVTHILVSWFDLCYEYVGGFQAGLWPGNYSLTLSSCFQNGLCQASLCSRTLDYLRAFPSSFQPCTLPITVDVQPGQLAQVTVLYGSNF